MVSGKNFSSKRQSDYGTQQEPGSVSRDGSGSKGKSVRHILSSKKLATLASVRDSNPTDGKRNLKSTYRIMLG